MPQSAIPLVRRPEQFASDDKRVIPRYLDLGHPPRIRAVYRRVSKLSNDQADALLAEVMARFDTRHRNLRAALEQTWRYLAPNLRGTDGLSVARRLLVAAYFTMEYSIESAALFNPSIVPHPDQSDLPVGSARFLMSMRATGEGHLSSIVFRRGVMDARGRITFDPPPRFAYTTRPEPDQAHRKAAFRRRMNETGEVGPQANAVLESLSDPFTTAQMQAALRAHGLRRRRSLTVRDDLDRMRWLAEANYTLHFPPDCHPAEIVIFPATRHEQQGMEDLRLVQFIREDGTPRYYGTYTAYDGHRTYPMLLETGDFLTFQIHSLSGRYAKNKGMALFPRKVHGQYLMIGRHDGENLFLMRSRNLHVWNSAQKIHEPTEPWELLQVGNCGSPLETEAGWILLTHGVGALRQYCIGALLLDRDDPGKVIGRLRQPFLAPNESEREGYVPNVVYSCGSMIHRGTLIVPYAVSDVRTTFAEVRVKDLLAAFSPVR